MYNNDTISNLLGTSHSLLPGLILSPYKIPTISLQLYMVHDRVPRQGTRFHHIRLFRHLLALHATQLEPNHIINGQA